MDRFVETPQGKAQVNWYRNHRLGITYLEIDGTHSKVVREDQVSFDYGDIKMDEKQSDINDMSYEKAKEHVKYLRERRERN